MFIFLQRVLLLFTTIIFRQLDVVNYIKQIVERNTEYREEMKSMIKIYNYKKKNIVDLWIMPYPDERRYIWHAEDQTSKFVSILINEQTYSFLDIVHMTL